MPVEFLLDIWFERPNSISPNWVRIDRPPNAGGHNYTEFRDKTGALKAVVKTDFLVEKANG